MERAAWDPGFYCLDQPIAVGLTDEFAFYRVVRDFHRDRGPEKLVFYNSVWHSADVMLAHGTIKAILHPDLGQILEVDTSDDYLIRLVDGTTLRVDSEEGAGNVDDAWTESASGETHPLRPLPTILNWRMVVEFDSLTDLRPDTGGWSRARGRTYAGSNALASISAEA